MAGDTEQPCCGTCRHFRPADRRYSRCVQVNPRPGWGDFEHMPVEPSEWCPEHSTARGDAVASGGRER